VILVNGVEQSVAPAADRGLAYGDGIFRTLAVRDGCPEHWRQHYAKLAHDCVQLRLPAPDEATVTAEVAAICRSQPRCAIKIIVTRGCATRGYALPDTPEPTRIVLGFPLPDYPRKHRERGVHVHLCDLRFAPQPALAGAKHLNRLENVLARAEWNTPHYAEGLVRDTEGNVISGTMSNVFMVDQGCLLTPDLARCGVAGVTRDRVMAAAQRHGMTCRVETVPLERTLECDEIFLVNSLIGIWPVQSLAGRSWRPGENTARMREWLDETEALS